MNKTRQKALLAALEQLRAVRELVKGILVEEEEAYEKMESRQMSQKGEDSASAIYEMKEALTAIKRAGNAIKKVTD